MDLDFYRGKRVLVTGHTGFKGMWLCKILGMAGTELAGYALDPPTEDGARVFHAAGVEQNMRSVYGGAESPFYPPLPTCAGTAFRISDDRRKPVRKSCRRGKL